MIAREQGFRVQGEQPLAYDLFREIIEQLGGRVDHVIVAAADDGAAATHIVISIDSGDTRIIRARPAGPVTLALKTGARVFVESSRFHRPVGTI